MESGDILQALLDNLAALDSLRSLLIIVAGSVLLLVLCTFWKTAQKYIVYLFALILVLALVTLDDEPQRLMNGDLVQSRFAATVQFVLMAFTLLLVLFGDVRKRNVEYQFLLLAVLVGSLLMTMAHDLLVIYLSIELTSLASYLLTAFSERKKGYEAAMKYLLTGAISSAVMIYGISLIYGAHQSLALTEMDVPTGMTLVGWVLFFGGILFKVSIVPFHFWVPNTYQAAPTSAVAFLSVVPKIGALVLLGNVLHAASSDALNDLLIGISVITIGIGTFSAIAQTKLKRLLAYGAIAHSGFMLPLVVFGGEGAQSAFLFYAIVYGLMNFGVFFFVHIHEERKDLELHHLDGLGRLNPVAGVAIVVVMLALIGLPPTGGFSIKLVLFSVVWEQYQGSSDTWLLAFFIVGILSSAISLYFYLKIPYHYFLVQAKGEVSPLKHLDSWLTTFFALLLLWFFLQPGILDIFTSTIGST